ncbi:glycoside hydrolase family 2 TIM barrel-domain containing protein [Pedobacter sp. Du54]|uniref:glycoside hydrolase family 2 TIM barrel-domain containing protein n=1 Tax=Pedobacter anseongensis TaxID=3133439 RepID=UPI0030AAD7F8
MRKKILLFLVFFSVFSFGYAQDGARKVINIDNDWNFYQGTSAGLARKINLPHTWNAFDVMDDEPGYFRGIGWYNKKLKLKPEWKGKKLFLHFEGANQETAVYLNDKKIANHIGGYTAFTVPLERLKFNGTDYIAVKVDNSYNKDIVPLTADFTFFGGIYRSVSLMVLENAYFEGKQYATNGVYVHAEDVSQTAAKVIVNGQVTSAFGLSKKLNLVSTLSDATGKKIKEVKSAVTIEPGKTISFQLPALLVASPRLWSPENPYLYQATTQLVDSKSGKIIDEVKTDIGLRFFSFDSNKGFFLNGMSYKLIGASRHQDFARMGNAVPASLQVKDIALLKEMGGNFLRVAHYPQNQAVLDACDRLGILTSVEIPIVNEITESEAFNANCITMQLEMIKQNYNHPSVIIWAYMNEVLLKMRYNNEPEKKQKYLKSIENLAQLLDDLTRKTDPTRYTMLSNHGDVSGYIKAGLVKIPQLVGWNLYQGWYGGKSEDFGPGLDKIHAQMPDKPILVTEFGADVDPRIHAFSPVKFDKSLEYGLLYHQIYIDAILKRPFVAGAAVWNLADFNSETRGETMPHVNNKGLLTLDRQPKNTYYLYKANFQSKPFLKIGNGSWPLRGGVALPNENSLTQNLQVMANTDSISLWVNGRFMGKNKVQKGVTTWPVPFNSGINQIKAVSYVKGIKLEDTITVNFKLIPFSLSNSTSSLALNILMGAQRQFIDEQKNELWIPSQIYAPGSWGSIGGEIFKIKNSGRQSYGTDKNIIGTVQDPIYQTQLIGLEAYQLDVPKGKYELTLHFAELMGSANQSNLPYNLDSLIATNKEMPEQRIFDVYLNDKQVIKNINLASTYGAAHSVQKKLECIVADDKGMKLIFKGIKGKAVLNALQVRRVE